MIHNFKNEFYQENNESFGNELERKGVLKEVPSRNKDWLLTNSPNAKRVYNLSYLKPLKITNTQENVDRYHQNVYEGIKPLNLSNLRNKNSSANLNIIEGKEFSHLNSKRNKALWNQNNTAYTKFFSKNSTKQKVDKSMLYRVPKISTDWLLKDLTVQNKPHKMNLINENLTCREYIKNRRKNFNLNNINIENKFELFNQNKSVMERQNSTLYTNNDLNYPTDLESERTRISYDYWTNKIKKYSSYDKMKIENNEDPSINCI